MRINVVGGQTPYSVRQTCTACSTGWRHSGTRHAGAW